MKRLLWLCPAVLLAQDPYRVAADHYHLLFENDWVRATRVTYGPHETAPVHDHPPTPTTLYIYLTDGGPMRFVHVGGENKGLDIKRKPVLAGAIRFAHGVAETHSVEYLGDQPTEYVRIELRTEPVDRPARDVRRPPPEPGSLPPGSSRVEFENGQVRIMRIVCEAGKPCPASDHPEHPAVVTTLSGAQRGQVEWVRGPRQKTIQGPAELLRLELKSMPVRQAPVDLHH